MEGSPSTMIKLNNMNWLIWKPKMEDILYCKDLYEPIEGDTAKPKDMDDEKWKRLHRKTIGNIRQWLDDSVFSHVSNETDAQVLWKKLEARYEQKTATNKAFLIRKLVNMKFKERGSIADHLNEFQSVVNQLATMKMVIEDELQALLLLSSLLDSWETLVVTMRNSAPDGKLSMGQVSSSLFNEETRRKLAGTGQCFKLLSVRTGGEAKTGVIRDVGNPKEDHNLEESPLKEENVITVKKNEEKNTIATFEGDEVVVLSYGEEECLHVGNEIEWVVDTGASYHATYNKEFFTSYRVGDFGTVKMGNTSHSKIVGIDDVCIRTSVGCMMTLRDVRHVLDLRLNLISGIALDREGYMNYFGNGVWKLTKGSLVVARGKACCTLYKTNLKMCRDGLNSIEDGTSPNLWHKRLGHMSEKGLQILVKRSFIPFAKGTKWAGHTIRVGPIDSVQHILQIYEATDGGKARQKRDGLSREGLYKTTLCRDEWCASEWWCLRFDPFIDIHNLMDFSP
ncbi:hypothetical protein F0562_007781 [Nyssa sinensis]|uniref:Uncharacterized protein n=1 Tax=Nyssa sinensis TaxID=561372 RepID=A0A5J5A790_9ASTE|nr:hypothetical protein F0562_007781 [Nyssa sinensis]